MSMEDCWSNDGGIFMAEDMDGWVLADELDTVFSQKKVVRYMNRHYHNTPRDIAEGRLSARERLSTSLLVGLTAVACLTGGVMVSNQAMDLLRGTC